MFRNKKKKDKKPFLSTFSKVIVFLSLVYGWILTTVSYIWAYLGYQPLTDLSSTIVSTIVGPTLTYLCSNALMTIFEKNQLAFSTPLSAIESGIVQSPTILNTSALNHDEAQDIPEPVVGTVDNPINLDELPLFEFGDAACGRGED